MPTEPYLILRVSPATGTAFDPLTDPLMRGPGPSKGLESLEPPTVEVQTAELNPRELWAARRDPQVAAVAQPMPLRLIAPIEVSPSPAAGGGDDPARPAPIHGATWGVLVTGALQSPYVGHGVTVAVLDTGIDAGHEAFRGIELIQQDFTGEGNGDRDGHGTHVAGTIFGQTGQGVRYAVAPGVRRALIGKVLGQQHSASTQDLVAAIQWAVAGGAQIINLSLGFDFPGLVQQWTAQGLAVDLATSWALARYRDNVRFFDRLVGLLQAGAGGGTGALLIAAAGNESRRQQDPTHVIEVSPPAAADGVVAVAALRSRGAPHTALTVAPFSNSRAALAAPGYGIYSAQAGGGYRFMAGTSMASPHVAGIAAHWAERQLQRNGLVNCDTLSAQVRGNTKRDRLPEASYLDIGEGLVTAPQE